MKKTIIFLITIGLSTPLFSQTGLKIGHINSQELLQAMPESDTAQTKLDKAVKELQNQLESMQVELNKKYQEYISKKDSISPLIKTTLEADLQQMNQRIQQFQQNAEQEIQKQRTEIFKPVLDKANKAIAEIAKVNGFTYILDLGAGTVIFHSDNSIDILPLVKQKLGIK